MKLLNCSNQGGTIITEHTARIRFYGELDSIQNIYNKSRLEKDGVLTGFLINNVSTPKEYAVNFYNALWWQFFKENPDMLKTVLEYDDYTDGVPENMVNSPARVFRMLKKYGLNGLGSNCKEFLIWLRNNREKRDDSFQELKKEAEQLLKNMSAGETKSGIMEKAREKNMPYLEIITSYMFDKKAGGITEALYNQMMAKVRKEIEDETNG